MRFSIITPVLDGAARIEHTLRAVRAQTHADWVQIVVDGGSTDGTRDIVLRFAAEDARVRLLDAPGTGIYAAVVRGFEAAEGDWLGWLNADDLYAPWALASVAEHVAASGCRWLTGLPGWWDDRGRLRAVRARAWAPRGLVAGGFFHERFLGCLQQESLFFAKSLFDDLSPGERAQIAALRYAGDFQLWRLFARRAELSILPAVLSGFRVHGENTSRRFAERYEAEVVALGVPVLPRWTIRPVRALFGVASGFATRRAGERALARLMSETGQHALPESPGALIESNRSEDSA